MFKQLDLRYRNVPSELAWGKIRINNFDHFGMTELCLSRDNRHDEIYISRTENGRNISDLRVEHYHRKAAQSEDYHRWYGEDGIKAKSKKWIMLPEGGRFQPERLVIKSIDKSWEHRTILHSKGSFSHHYKKEDTILVVTYRAFQLESMLDDPLFNCVAENLVITEGEPELSIVGFDYKGLDHGITESPLHEEEASEIDVCTTKGMIALGMAPSFAPNFSAINAIHLYILKLRKERKKLNKDKREQLAIDLGCL